ncbi:MAG: hypothetical protein IJK26_09290 [Clostridia bacterium]|nr:hypothetical protein [Clostridia bacterium]
MKGERYLKVVLLNYNDVDKGKAEAKLNKALKELSNNNKIVSVVPHHTGLKPFNLIYNIYYEQGTPEAKTSRFVKIITMTIDEINSSKGEIIEQLVNAAHAKIVENKGRIINNLSHNFGFSPVKVMYDIVYEAEKPIE